MMVAMSGKSQNLPIEGHDWVPYSETVRPADLARCRFELMPGSGAIAIFADDYDAAGRIFRWLVGQAMQEKANDEAQAVPGNGEVPGEP